MSLFVLDASVTLCWLFEDQATTYTETVLESLAGIDEALVASVWPLEVVNSMVISERRKLITPAQIASFKDQLRELPITVSAPSTQTAFGAVFDAARRFVLSAYDAEYLELAARHGVPLATLDGQLRRAATVAGVKLV